MTPPDPRNGSGIGSRDSVGAGNTKPGTLSNDWFVNLLDIGTEWSKVVDLDRFDLR